MLQAQVVEDGPSIREIVRFVLEDEGFAVRTAATADEALARNESAPPTVVIDLNLPGGSMSPALPGCYAAASDSSCRSS